VSAEPKNPESSKAVCKTLPVTIRRARIDELEACAALYERAGNEAFTWRPPGWFKAAAFLEHTKSEEVYVAESRGAILGVLAFFRPSNFVHSLYIEPSAQGFGIGTAMIEAAAKIADHPLSLKVDEPNTKARKFYEKLGFIDAHESGLDSGIRWLRLKRTG
jgi:ribosomal protein S18 acetylase RimI-like enzyme